MEEKKKLLILASGQFGYSTTLLKFCEYSVSILDITYIGWDYNLPKIDVAGVRVHLVSRESSLIIRNLRLLYRFHKEVKKGYDVVFATYFRGISLVQLLNPKSNVIIYIDTLGVMLNQTKRSIYDFILKKELIGFDRIAVISDGLAKKMKLSKYHILPIGGECFSQNAKTYDTLRLLYVGTLDNRNIIDCVKGFHQFLKESKQGASKATFTIIGDGPNNELNEISEYVTSNKLEFNIKLKGFLPQHQLFSYFEEANVGVSYVPMFPYYEYQPVTKTYEYLISGLPTIATGTYENKLLITSGMGVVIQDNPESFCEGLLEIKGKFFKSEVIRNEYAQYSWKNVVNSKFIPLIEEFVGK